MLEESPHQQRMLQVTSTDLSPYEHEDSPVKFDFNHDDVEEMEKYDMEFYDDQFPQEDDPCLASDANMSKIMDQVTFPHSAKEPELSADELLRLDTLADQLELQRLERLQVSQRPDAVPPTSKVLSTRFVRTWREKRNSKGEAIWLRRSRFVAREFACLGETRQGKHGDGQLGRERCFSDCEARARHLGPYNRCKWNNSQFSLGKVLPGQRDGSLLWYRAITSFLKSKLDLEEHTPYPISMHSSFKRWILRGDDTC